MKKSLALFATVLAAVLNAATPSTSLVYKNTTTNALTGNIVVGNNTTISATGNGTITATALTGNISGNPTVSGNLTVSGGSIVNGAGSAVYYFGTPSNNYMYYDGSSLYTRVGGSDRLTISGSTGNATFGSNLLVGGYITANGVYNAGVNSLSAPLLLGGNTQGGDGGYSPRLQVANPSNGDKYVAIGYDNATDMGFLFPIHRGTAWKTLSINPVGAGNVLIGTTTDTGEKLQVVGDGKFSGSVYAEKSGAGIAGQSTGAITQFTTVNSTTYNVITGSAKVFVVQLASGDAALCYASYKSSTITILGSDGTIINSSSPDTGQLGIYKSANNHVISFKTGSNALAGGYASWGFCFVGNPIISISNP